MPLSRGLARSIVEVVDKDAECRRRINSVVGDVAPAGWAGGVRNLGFIASQIVSERKLFVQPSAEQDDLVCYGIRDATIAALDKAIGKAKRDDDLKTITDVSYAIRDSFVVHTATQITIAKKWTYIFDWHATLQTKNPLLYPSLKAFEDGKREVQFKEFTGFDV